MVSDFASSFSSRASSRLLPPPSLLRRLCESTVLCAVDGYSLVDVYLTDVMAQVVIRQSFKNPP